MKQKIKRTFPPIGMRIIKSAVAIAVCYLVSFLRGNSGIVFYSQLAALWCMQPYVAVTKKNAFQRTIGTVIGAIYGLIFLLMQRQIHLPDETTQYVNAGIISLMIAVIIYTTILIKKKQASYFSCVVFLSIVVNHVTDSNPYLFVWNRFLDTMIGIVIGVGVNNFHLPTERKKDILFISGLDDTLLHEKDDLSDYSRVELNRMLDDGANFTVSTMRTPASIMETMREIRLKLPVIAMDGAVLYDTKENKYLKTYVISNAMSKKLIQTIWSSGLSCYINVVVDDMLEIFYKETEDEFQRKFVEKMRRSPYRNYIKSEELHAENVVYFMLLYPSDVIADFYNTLVEQEFTEKLKVLTYASKDYPGYSYIKIFNKNATKDHMANYLKEMLGIQETVTFGSIPGRYDVVVAPGDTNKVVQELKKRYEPIRKLF
jgi:hydroxymethylpyrimidine pyrophosphatase-like HAD family hydrolase